MSDERIDSKEAKSEGFSTISTVDANVDATEPLTKKNALSQKDGNNAVIHDRGTRPIHNEGTRRSTIDLELWMWQHQCQVLEKALSDHDEEFRRETLMYEQEANFLRQKISEADEERMKLTQKIDALKIERLKQELDKI